MAFPNADEPWSDEKYDFNFTACVREFSDTSIHKPGQAAELDDNLQVKNDYIFGCLSDPRMMKLFTAGLEELGDKSDPQVRAVAAHNWIVNPHSKYFRAQVFANGIDSENEGCVSVLLESLTLHHYCSQCIVAVMDANGEERYLSSFSFPYKYNEKQRCLIHQYVKRDTLLKEPFELLPDDCLTVRVRVDMKIHIWRSDWANEIRSNGDRIDQTVAESFTTRLFGEEESCCLSLDSEVFGKLSEASSYFQSMSEIPMEEQRTRLMKIPP